MAAAPLTEIMEVRVTRIGGTLREGLLIGGWVAMWRPLEIQHSGSER
jgi:hypothetical protein